MEEPLEKKFWEAADKLRKNMSDDINITSQQIENRIFSVRNEFVMIGSDLAELDQVATKVLNQAVKRNAERFPDSFRFRLTMEEATTICSRSQFVTLNKGRGQNITSGSVILKTN